MQSLRTDTASSVAIVTLTFLSWFLSIYLGRSPYPSISHEDLANPLLWSCALIYLYRRNHIYIAINAYTIFLVMMLADGMTFDEISSKSQFAYMLFSVVLVSALILIYQELLLIKKRYLSIIILMITLSLYIFPILFVIYTKQFDSEISRDIFYAIFQSDQRESLEFISIYISPVWVSLVVLIFVFVGFLLLNHERKNTLKIDTQLLVFFAAIGSISCHNKFEDLRLYSLPIDAFLEYKRELYVFKETQKKIEQNEIQFDAKKAGENETYIVVIGESLNKRHMGIYGYMRDTTPKLSEMHSNNSLLLFDNVYSSHTHTMPVLSLSLTEANNRNKKDFYESLSIINLLNKADVETYWITNQNLYGPWDNLVSIMAHQANTLVPLNRSIGENTLTQKYDGAVIHEVKNILSQNSDKNRVIFIHLMGSHSDYCSRYPKEFEFFDKKLARFEFGNISSKKYISKGINCYDNSIIYNDYVISTVLQSLVANKGVDGFLYFSDHSEDVLNQLGHDSNNFTYEMIQIPLIMWFSGKYMVKYQDKYEALKSHKSSLYSNDSIYDTLAGIIGIDTNKYLESNDLSSKDFFSAEENAYTMLGRIHYTGKLNRIYHQKENIKALTTKKLGSRAIPHRINSTGKLSEVWHDKYRAFEIDVVFRDEKKPYFEVGHDLSAMSGISFEKFLSTLTSSEIEKIWVDLKNLSPENYHLVLARLDRLDDRFSLKSKLIIESNTTDTFFREFQKLGWHTSYYLPTEKLMILIKNNNLSEINNVSKNITGQLFNQGVSAISFDYRLYPFVKEHLEPNLPKNVVYHTWDLSINLFDSELYSDLRQKSYFIDDRVKTILLPYQSPFSL